MCITDETYQSVVDVSDPAPSAMNVSDLKPGYGLTPQDRQRRKVCGVGVGDSELRVYGFIARRTGMPFEP